MAAFPKAPEPRDVFTNLTTTLPEWITHFSTLSAHASKKNAEFVAEYSRLVSAAKPRRTRSASLQSLHTNDDKSVEGLQLETKNPEGPVSPPNPADISPFEAGNRYLYAQARRKRKPGTSIRSGASGPQKFRSKQMVIIYYDSYIQEQLESIVKKIGGARNELRKAKTTRAVTLGFRLPTLGRKYNAFLSASTDAVRTAEAQPEKPLSGAASPTASVESADFDDNTFMDADKDLEAAQTLCETAAHQFLRDGDCKLELDNARTKLEAVLERAGFALRQLDAEEKEKKPITSNPSGEDMDTDSQSTLSVPLTEGYTAKMMPPVFQEKQSGPGLPLGLATTDIEVDDNSDVSSIVVDISKFRTVRASRFMPT